MMGALLTGALCEREGCYKDAQIDSELDGGDTVKLCCCHVTEFVWERLADGGFVRVDTGEYAGTWGAEYKWRKAPN